MCSVIGVYCKNTAGNRELVNSMILESKIRGKHATGVTMLIDNKFSTNILPVPSDVFLESFEIPSIEDIKMVGHCRYSTSNIEFNQPIVINVHALVHNGVITQEHPDNWYSHYGIQCTGENDSELLLRSYMAGDDFFTKYPKASISAIILNKDGDVFFFRNGSRPLWYFATVDGVFISSTEDILKRSFKAPIEPKKCEAGIMYQLQGYNAVRIGELGEFRDIQVSSISSEYYSKVDL